MYGKPAEYVELLDDQVGTSDESDEKSSIPESYPPNNYPVSVYTKYPDDPYDSYKVPDDDDLPTPGESRTRRQTGCNETDPSIDINKQVGETEDVKRSERRTEELVKLPLRGFISAIESDLVSRALNVNAQLNRRKRSIESIVDHDDDDDSDEDNDSNDNKTSSNTTITDDSVDVNKDFFEGIFNYTRPQRETEEKDVKIPLNGLVSAIETTLVHSAQNLKDLKHTKREVSTEENHELSTESIESHRISRDTSNDQEPKTDADIKVAKIAASNNIDLNLLSPIAFKTQSTAHVTTEEPNHSDEEATSTTEQPIQRTNVTVIQASASVSLVPGPDKKLAHVQHQEISRTVFHSSLAIFPTIPPQSINAPLPHFTTTEEPIDTTIIPKATPSTMSKSEDELKHEQMLQKADKLKEKFAEIQAEPVILSQI